MPRRLRASPRSAPSSAGRGTTSSARRSTRSSRRRRLPETWEEGAPPRRLDAPGRPPELRIVAKAAKTRGLTLAARSRARAPHVPPSRAPGRRADGLGGARVPRFAGGVPRRARPHRARRDPPHAHVREGDRAARPRASATSPFATGSGSASPGARTRRRSSPRWASGSRARTSSTPPRTPRAFARPATRTALACRRSSAAKRSRTCASAPAGSRPSPARPPSTSSAGSRRCPPPLSPLLMRGRPLHRDARRRGGQPEAFLDQLDAWQPDDLPGS